MKEGKYYCSYYKDSATGMFHARLWRGQLDGGEIFAFPTARACLRNIELIHWLNFCDRFDAEVKEIEEPPYVVGLGGSQVLGDPTK